MPGGTHTSPTGRKFEVSTSGYDPALAIIGGNPYGTPTGPGLIVPSVQPTQKGRYLFMLAAHSLNVGESACIVGIRQFASIAALVPGTTGSDTGNYNYVLELPITTPFWHFQDANISWSLRRLDPQPNLTGAGALASTGPVINASVNFSSTPSVLVAPDSSYEISPGGDDTPGSVIYLPANGGRPYGNPVIADLGNFQDIRFPWESDRAWDSLNIPITGPCTIALFASVLQSNVDTRQTLTVPGSLPGGTAGNCFPPEELFLLNFPTAVYRRVAGSIVFQETAFSDFDAAAQPVGPFEPKIRNPQSGF